jgi:hypothetical protein
MQTSPDQETERYLCSGEQDHMFASWPGNDLFARAKHGRAALRGALISTVRSRTRHAVAPAALCTMDAVAFTRVKVAPMVRRLFPQCQQAPVLEVLGRSVVFLTPSTIDAALENTPWPRTAWVLANLYLASCGAELLAEDVPEIVGLSEETTWYVSMEYFHEQGRIDDFVVHEAAHIFIIASGGRSVCAKYGDASGCWRSISSSAKPLHTRARRIAASSNLPTARQPAESCCPRWKTDRCLRASAWLRASTLISFARPSLPVTVGRSSWHDARQGVRSATA